MISLKRRLIVAATGWITVGLVVAGLMLSSVFRQHVTEQFWEELYVHLAELERLAEIKDGNVAFQRNLSDPRYEVDLSGYYWEIQKAGKILARSQSLKGAVLQVPADESWVKGVHTHSIIGPTGEILVAEKRLQKVQGAAPIQFLIGTDERHLETVIDSFNRTLSWALTAFGLSMVLAASLLILYALKPMQQLRSGLAEVRLGRRKSLDGAFPSEVQPLVDDLNAFLSSSSALILRARTQAGNLAHGLKTPLAIIVDEAHNLSRKGLNDASQTILEQSKQMQTQIDYQTARARAIAMRSTPGNIASLDQAATAVTAAFERLTRGRTLDIRNQIREDINVACDPQDLNEMLANLVDNAVKHADAHVRLSCARLQSQHKIEIRIEDDGPGLPEEAYKSVFEVGRQWAPSQSGSGLGLAILCDLARLYEGEVRLGRSDLGGLLVKLTLPCAQMG